MKRIPNTSVRTRVILITSIPFLCFFVFGVTDFGQKILQGDIPAGTNHWKADDIVMGAGLAPWVYGMIPFIFGNQWIYLLAPRLAQASA
jgi:hypothetical protein